MSRVLLLVPLVALLVPLYNRVEPRLLGVPFFYWAQLAGLLLGVLCMLVALRGRDRADQGRWR